MFEKALISFYDNNLKNIPLSTVRLGSGKDNKNPIVIEIDLSGNKISSKKEKIDLNGVYIPSTIDSAKPSSKDFFKKPRPFFNSLKYFFERDENKNIIVDDVSHFYTDLIHKFNVSKYRIPESMAIEKYLIEHYKKEDILDNCDIIDDKHNPYVLFRIVDINAENGGDLWTNTILIENWNKFYSENPFYEGNFKYPKITFTGTSFITGDNEDFSFNCSQKNNIIPNYIELCKVTTTLDVLGSDKRSSHSHAISIDDDNRDTMIFFTENNSVHAPIDECNGCYIGDSEEEMEIDETNLAEDIVKTITTKNYVDENLQKNHESSVYILELKNVSSGCCSIVGYDVLGKDQYLKNIDAWKKIMTYKFGNKTVGISIYAILRYIFEKQDCSERGRVKKSLLMSMIMGRKIEEYIVKYLENKYVNLHSTCDFFTKKKSQKEYDVNHIREIIEKIGEYNKMISNTADTENRTYSYYLGWMYGSLCQIEKTYNRKNSIERYFPIVFSSMQNFMRNPFETADMISSNKLSHVFKWADKENMHYLIDQYNDARYQASNVVKTARIDHADFAMGEGDFWRMVDQKISEKNLKTPIANPEEL